MRRTLIALAFLTGLVAACTGSAATGAPQVGGTQAVGTQTSPPQGTPVATGTSGSTSSPAGGVPKTPVACSLITADEAAAALGVAVNPGAAGVAGENACSFGGHALADMINFVEIAVVDPAEFTPTRSSVPSVFTITQVSGIGDAAYYQKGYLPNNSGTSMDLHVSKGGTTFTVSIVLQGASDSQLMAAEKTLALAAVGRILP